MMTRNLYCDFCQQEIVAERPLDINYFLQTGPRDTVWQCPECGLLFRPSLPQFETAGEKRRIMAEKAIVYGEHAAGDQFINRRMRKRLRKAWEMASSGTGGTQKKLLDVGAGTGAFLRAASESGWEAAGTEVKNVSGNKDDARIYNTDIAVSSIHGEAPESFDVVHCNHVLEHVKSVRSMLNAIYYYLTPGGFLFLEVPNEIYSLASRMKRWLGIRHNSATGYFTHRYFFNADLLQRFLLDTGYVVVNITTPYMDVDLPWWHRLFDRVQSWFNKGGVIEVMAQKTVPHSSSGTKTDDNWWGD